MTNLELTLRVLPANTFPGNDSILQLLLGFTRLFSHLFIYSLRLFRSVIIENVHHHVRIPQQEVHVLILTKTPANSVGTGAFGKWRV